GNYTVTITGQAGSISHSATANIRVVPEQVQITDASFSHKRLTITGQGFDQIIGVAINGKSITANSISSTEIIANGRRRALGIMRGSNEIELTLNGNSQMVTFTFQ